MYTEKGKLYTCKCGMRFHPARRKVRKQTRFGLCLDYVTCPSCKRKVRVKKFNGEWKF